MSDDSSSLSLPGSGSHQVYTLAGAVRASQVQVDNSLAVIWRKILLGIILIEIPLQFDTYLFHDLSESEFGAISGFNVSLTTICIALLYVQWLPRLVVQSTSLHLNKSLLAYLGLTALSVLWASSRALTFFELNILIQAFLIFTYVVNTVTTRSEIKFVVWLLLTGMGIQGLLMAATRYLGANIELGPIGFTIDQDSHRVNGSLGSPNVAASYLALLIAPALCVLFTPVSRSLRRLAFVALFLGASGLFLTMSRGGWIATAFPVLICCVVAYRNGWISGRIIAMLAVGLVILMAAFQQILIARIFGEDLGSAVSRVPLNQISAQLIANHPLGVGANNWSLAAQTYSEQSRFREEWFYTIHNKYLLVWAEIGFVGLIAFLAFLCSTICTGWRTFQRGDKLLAPLALGCAAAIAGQMIHMGFDIFNSRIQVQMLWLIAALVFAISNVSEESEKDNAPAV